jgi:hypothetical protein
LNDTELKLRLRNGITIATFRALEAHTMQYVLRNTPASTLPFPIKKDAGFLEGYNLPINTTVIPDRIHTNVQLTQFRNNAAQKRGTFLRKFSLPGGNYLVVVRFGGEKNTTDVLCIVNSAGTVLNMLEGSVTVNGMMVKKCTITPAQVIVYQATPSSTTASLSFFMENFAGFTNGSVVTTFYNISGSSFVRGSVNTGAAKTFTKSILVDGEW